MWKPCPWCGKWVQHCNDGCMRMHSVYEGGLCPGSRKRPEDVPFMLTMATALETRACRLREQSRAAELKRAAKRAP